MYLIPVHIVTEFYCRTVGVRHDHVHDFHSPVLLLYERISNFVVGQYVTRNGRQLYKADDGKYYPSFAAAVQAGTEDSWRNLLGEGTVLAGELGKRSDYAAEQGRARGSRSVLPELGITEYVGQFLKDLGTLGQYNLGRRFGGAEERDPFASAPVVVPPLEKAVDDTSPAPGLDLSRPKPFAMTPEGQFDRYFKTPEFDYVFGAGSRGQGAPADAAAMEKLAFEQKAPTDAPLATFYRAQSAAGRGNMPDIVAGITAGKGEKEAAALAKWAEANPMLAQRLYAQTNVGYDTPRMSPESEAMLKAVGGEQGEFITRQPGPNMPVGDTDIEQYEGERIIEAINDEKARKSGSVRDRADEFVGNLYSSYMK